MRRIVVLSIMALTCLTTQAQGKNDVVELAKSSGVWISRPEPVVDKKSKKKVVTWFDTEKNDWYEQSLVLDKVPTVKDYNSLFPEMAQAPKDMPYTPMTWRLTEENDETVLHCYLQMPADVVNKFWLTDEEGAILDKETGITYRVRRTEPSCYRQMFGIKAKEGSVLDFKIIFPKLPESTREIAIYGVPNWFLRGMDVTLNRQPVFNLTINYYDTIPQFHKPRLLIPAKDYDKDNFRTWAEYTDAHLIKPVKENTMGMWITREATYLAVSTELNWVREYFGRGEGVMLMDQYGHQYKCKEVMDYPKGTLFWVQGYSGDYFAIVLVFEPIPLTLEAITYIEPESEPFHVRNANWDGQVIPNLDIKTLRQNQKLFEYHPRIVVK